MTQQPKSFEIIPAGSNRQYPQPAGTRLPSGPVIRLPTQPHPSVPGGVPPQPVQLPMAIQLPQQPVPAVTSSVFPSHTVGGLPLNLAENGCIFCHIWLEI